MMCMGGVFILQYCTYYTHDSLTILLHGLRRLRADLFPKRVAALAGSQGQERAEEVQTHSREEAAGTCVVNGVYDMMPICMACIVYGA